MVRLRRGRGGSSSRRIAWSVLDQGSASARNFVLIFLLAKDASIAEFGLLMIGYSIFSLGVGVARNSFGGILGIDLPKGSISAGSDLVPRSIAATFSFGVPLGILITMYGVTVPDLGTGKYSLFLLALVSPIILLQDLQRFWAVAAGDPARAAVVDLLWLMVAVAGFMASDLAGGESATHLGVTVWGAGAILAHLQFRTMGYWRRPQFRGMVRWAVSDRRRFQLGGDALLVSLSPLITSSVIAMAAGAPVVAAIRGAGTLFGPFNLLIATFPLVLVPEAIRAGPARSRQLFVLAAILFATLSMFWGVVLHLMSADIGMALLGKSWLVVQPIVLITAIEYAARGTWASSRARLRSEERLSAALCLRMGFTLFMIVVPVVAAIAWGTPMAVAIGLAGNALIFAVVGWIVSSRPREDSQRQH